MSGEAERQEKDVHHDWVSLGAITCDLKAKSPVDRYGQLWSDFLLRLVRLQFSLVRQIVLPNDATVLHMARLLQITSTQ